MEIRMRRSLLLLALSVTGCSANADSHAKDADGVVMIAEDDAEMEAAITHAKSTLNEFLATVANPPAGSSGFKLKVELTDSNGSEHFWVEPFKQTATGFEGTLANHPEIISGVKLGQTISFARSQVSDWGYVLNGRQVGSFTVCVMMKHVSADEANIYRRDYGFDCPV
jgi:uncharacterized protein YegJ (DUF2314 family)